MAPTTTNRQLPTEAEIGAKTRSADANRQAPNLSDAQLRALAEKIYQLLRDEARVTLERQGH